MSPSADFESAASAIPPHRQHTYVITTKNILSYFSSLGKRKKENFFKIFCKNIFYLYFKIIFTEDVYCDMVADAIENNCKN